jgi:peptide/nickel transport system ATP-binding protein
MYAGRKVEEGPVADILGAPRHPYTQALLAAAPRLGSANGLDVPPRLSEMPGAARPGSTIGCAFAPRCVRVFEKCLREAPLVATIGPDRTASCHALEIND